MPVFLDPTGRTHYGIGICDRCKMKQFIDDLESDPNYPGLKVCSRRIKDGCKDDYDPWRLPARQTEKINLPFVRPDTPLNNSVGDYTVDRNGDLQPNTGFTPEV